MAKYVLDTNIYISRLADKVPTLRTLYTSSVVLFERMTAAPNQREYNQYLALWRVALKEGTLLVPTEADWKKASLISFQLALQIRAQAGGNAPKQLAGKKQQVALDCLLAASAAREGVEVWTTNDSDFLRIQPFFKNLTVTIITP